MTSTSTSSSQPSPAFPATMNAITSQWYEVAASFDARVDVPRAMEVCAITDAGVPHPFLTSTCLEIELPGGFVIPLDFMSITAVQQIVFPVRWRIAKPATVDAVTFIVFGTGVTANTND